MNSWNINGYVLEYIDSTHTYMVDGIIVPSITTILKIKFGNKYDGISKEVLERASIRGTQIHNEIENYCRTGNISDSKEVKNFIFLQKNYKFDVLDNEVPIILFKDGKPIASGRLDMIIRENEEVGLGDIKRVSKLDKEYLTYQLNLYRIGYQQCYGKEIKFLRGIHLKDDVRKYVDIKVNEEQAMDLINEYFTIHT